MSTKHAGGEYQPESEREARMCLSWLLAQRNDAGMRSYVNNRVFDTNAMSVWGELSIHHLLGYDWDPGHREWNKLAASLWDTDLFAQMRDAVSDTPAVFITPADETWPASLAALRQVSEPGFTAGPPVGLWVRGDGSVAKLSARSLAVVGSPSTSYGQRFAYNVSTKLNAEVVLVTNGHGGIARNAIQAAITAGRPQLCILAAGVDFENTPDAGFLTDALDANAVMVSEIPPGIDPARLNAGCEDANNRLIAALAPVTLLVETTPGSSAMNVVQWAQSLYRRVVAIPGNVDVNESVVSNELIRSHNAVMVTNASDIETTLAANPTPRLASRLGETHNLLDATMPSVSPSRPSPTLTPARSSEIDVRV
jgi:DNA processing protein